MIAPQKSADPAGAIVGPDFLLRRLWQRAWDCGCRCGMLAASPRQMKKRSPGVPGTTHP